MKQPDIQYYLDQIYTLIISPAHVFFKNLPQDSLPLILGAAGCVALLAALVAYFALRPTPKQKHTVNSAQTDFAHFLQKGGTIFDVALPEEHENVAGRAVVTGTSADHIKLEIIENKDFSDLKPSRNIILMFPPEKIGGIKSNALVTKLLSIECNDDESGRLKISLPTSFKLIKRRQHKRKRVVDQQFIRVKMWRGAAENDDASFADAAPDLAVNSYDPRATGHEDNEVINISNGGIAVSVNQRIVDAKFSINDDVLISIFMFNFRQKVFKPYWYAGKIRTIEEMDAASSRLGVEFTMTGLIRDESEQYIDWSSM